MPEELKLLPCPACGEAASLVHNRKQFWVTCLDVDGMKKGCSLTTGKYATQDGAAAAWNALPRALTWTTETPTRPGTYSIIYKDKTMDTIHYFKLPSEEEEVGGAAYWLGPLPSAFGIICGMGKETTPMTFLDLCAGIGGFSLGLERAGMICGGQVEIDDYCNRILEKHWPHVPRWGDLTKLDPAELPKVDIICGGYPCQPFSLAGKRQGAGDDRHIWPQIRKIIDHIRPTWCLFENVAGHISMGLDAVLSDLEGQGYTCGPIVIPACAVDAPHRRDRVWIVAHSNGKCGEARPFDRPLVCAESKGQGANGIAICPSEGGGSRAMAHAAGAAMHDGHAAAMQWGRQEQAQQVGVGCCRDGGAMAHAQSHTVRAGLCADEQAGERRGRSGNGGGPHWHQWQVEPAVGRVADGLSTELDEVAQRCGCNGSNSSQALAEIDDFRGKVLYAMWCECQFTTPSSFYESARLCTSMPRVPQEFAYDAWVLGQRIKEDKEMRNMWNRICSAPFKETQDVQQVLLVRIRENECAQKVGKGRTDRLRALGNAVVPQVVEAIGRAIMAAHEKGPPHD